MEAIISIKKVFTRVLQYYRNRWKKYKRTGNRWLSCNRQKMADDRQL